MGDKTHQEWLREMKKMRILIAISLAAFAASAAAMLVWFAGIFVEGKYYSFLSTGERLSPSDASMTRFIMLFVFVMVGFIVFSENATKSR
jgi:apolipoprotein N-acyltransferase